MTSKPLQDGTFGLKNSDQDSLIDHKQFVLGYDGDCPLCNRVVAFLLWADSGLKLQYIAQETDAGQRLLRQYALPEVAIDAVWLATAERLYLGPTAVMRILLLLPYQWRLLWFLCWLCPKPLRRWLYGLIARNRKQLFGSFVCEMPRQQRWG